MERQFETLAWVKYEGGVLPEVWAFEMDDAKRLASRMAENPNFPREIILRDEAGGTMLVRIHEQEG